MDVQTQGTDFGVMLTAMPESASSIVTALAFAYCRPKLDTKSFLNIFLILGLPTGVRLAVLGEL